MQGIFVATIPFFWILSKDKLKGSNIVNEVIKIILDFFIFFFNEKISHAQKSIKSMKR